jgi:20S proteasome subunit alpha 5
MDPSGTYVEYEAKAIGSGSEGAQQSLQEKYHRSISLNEAIKESLIILKQVMEEKLNETNIEVATVTKKDGFQILSALELQAIIKELS